MARPRKNKAESSASSADEKVTQATSQEADSQTPTDEVTPPAPDTETPEVTTPPAPDTPKDKSEKKDKGAKLHPDIAATFEARPDIACAYVSGDQWYFDKQIAKAEFESFEVIPNPHHKA